MIYELSEKLKRKIYGRLERSLLSEREVIREVQTSSNRRPEVSDSSMVSRGNEKKIPDPWFDK